MIKTKHIPKFTFKIKTTKKQLLGIYIFIIQRIIEKSSKIIITSKLPVQCTDNVIMFYINLFSENIIYIYIIAYLLYNFVSNEFIIKSNNYKLHTYIYYNYFVQLMSNN